MPSERRVHLKANTYHLEILSITVLDYYVLHFGSCNNFRLIFIRKKETDKARIRGFIHSTLDAKVIQTIWDKNER